jgi:hypothetical protein
MMLGVSVCFVFVVLKVIFLLGLYYIRYFLVYFNVFYFCFFALCLLDMHVISLAGNEYLIVCVHMDGKNY